jgi:hypothetical protein
VDVVEETTMLFSSAKANGLLRAIAIRVLNKRAEQSLFIDVQ